MKMLDTSQSYHCETEPTATMSSHENLITPLSDDRESQRRHSVDLDGTFDGTFDGDFDDDFDDDVEVMMYPLSPVTPDKKKKSKSAKDKLRKSKSKTRRGPKSLRDLGIGEETGGSCVGVDGRSVKSGKSSSKRSKKKRDKKYGYNSEALGCVIIPDCDEDCYEDEKEVENKSTHNSMVTLQTSMMDDDEFTAATKETKESNNTNSKPKKAPKKAKRPSTDKDKKVKRTKSKDPSQCSSKRTKSKDPSQCSSKRMKSKDPSQCSSHSKARTKSKTRTKSKDKSRRGSLLKKEKSSSNRNVNASWGADPQGTKSFMAPELLSLLMDPAMQVGDSDSNSNSNSNFDDVQPISQLRLRPGTQLSLKKANSFTGGPKRPTQTLGRQRGSLGNLNDAAYKALEKARSTTRTRATTKGRRKKEASTTEGGGKHENANASWGAPPPPPRDGPKSSYSPELLNLYTTKKKVEKPSPGLRRNVKSFAGNGSESWRTDPKRDDDIPNILFLSPENSHCCLNESWSTRGTTDKSASTSASTSVSTSRRGLKEKDTTEESAMAELDSSDAPTGASTSGLTRKKSLRRESSKITAIVHSNDPLTLNATASASASLAAKASMGASTSGLTRKKSLRRESSKITAIVHSNDPLTLNATPALTRKKSFRKEAAPKIRRNGSLVFGGGASTSVHVSATRASQPPLPLRRNSTHGTKNESWGSSANAPKRYSEPILPLRSPNARKKKQLSPELAGVLRSPSMKSPHSRKKKQLSSELVGLLRSPSMKESAGMLRSPAKPQLSPELVGMLMGNVSPQTAAKLNKSSGSSSRMKKSTSFGDAMMHSPSLGGIRSSLANFKKLRGARESRKIPNQIPDLNM